MATWQPRQNEGFQYRTTTNGSRCLFAWKWKDTNVIEYAVGFFTIRPEGYKVIHCGTRNLVEGMSLDQVNLFWTELPSLP